VCAAYRHWFEHGVANGGEENLRASLAECGQGQHVDRILGEADGADVSRELNAATEEAWQLGVFGLPTFAVGPSCLGR
jgi:2-hydroxychromene-2-carboxylate isomerase